MTSPVDTSVKYFHSAMTGAPVMSGTAGALIAVLDACLVNGFGVKTVDSLVVAGNVATMIISSGHSAEVGGVQLVAGATPSALNGEQKVTAVTATTISFATTGISNQTATGTITAKVAPAGWAKTYSGTNLAAYKPTDVTATGCLLRVDDTVGKTARMVGYETMSDVNTGTGPFPTTAQRSGGTWWDKSNAADATARTWVLVSDSRFFYLATERYIVNLGANELVVFGDLIPTKSGDAYSCVLTGQASDKSGVAPAALDNYWNADPNTINEVYCPRPYTGIGSSSQQRKNSPGVGVTSTNWSSGGAGNNIPYPNAADGGLYVTPHYVIDGTSFTLRGQSPGFYMCPQNVPNGNFSTRDTVVGVAGMVGKTLKALTCTPSPYGVAFFDITGPWR